MRFSSVSITSCPKLRWISVWQVRRRSPRTADPALRSTSATNQNRDMPRMSGRYRFHPSCCRCTALWRLWSDGSSTRRHPRWQPADWANSLLSHPPSPDRNCRRWSADACCAAHSREVCFRMSAAEADRPVRHGSENCRCAPSCRPCSQARRHWVCSLCGTTRQAEAATSQQALRRPSSDNGGLYVVGISSRLQSYVKIPAPASVRLRACCTIEKD